VHRKERLPRLQIGARLDRDHDRAAARGDAGEVTLGEAAPEHVERVHLQPRLAGVGEELGDVAGAAHAVPLVAQPAGVQAQRIAGIGRLRDRDVAHRGEAGATVGGRVDPVGVQTRDALARAFGEGPLLRSAPVEHGA
jgi:hypothetical protein